MVELSNAEAARIASWLVRVVPRSTEEASQIEAEVIRLSHNGGSYGEYVR